VENHKDNSKKEKRNCRPGFGRNCPTISWPNFSPSVQGLQTWKLKGVLIFAKFSFEKNREKFCLFVCFFAVSSL